MKRTRIKFCGITRHEDVQHASFLGVDAIGFVFSPDSPRSIDVQHACTLSSHSGAFMTRVGLFMNQDAGTINSVIREVPLDLLQFHGTESEEFCCSFGMPYIKSIAMGGRDRLSSSPGYDSATALLFDSNEIGQPGGSGKQFDWDMLPDLNRPIILAGGLDQSNVAEAINKLKPYAVDVSSGIEIDKGVKDQYKMNEFVKSVRKADEC